MSRRDILDALHRYRSQLVSDEDAADEIIEECAVAAEQKHLAGKEWVHDSLWANILGRAGRGVRALKRGA